ncbi:helix-turn-helix domain-containing protein [Actinoplanes sp. NPDC051494]|uniref:helix-turn-helix domain-containing protein n=1 Tax=Actinoplanes sp. NPDC051494 TaxID=3363907 RepID=UPI00378883F8
MPTKVDGTAIRRLRESRGLSCPQLAQELGYNPAFIWKIENEAQGGGGSPASRKKIADYFGVPVERISRFVPVKPRTTHRETAGQAA